MIKVGQILQLATIISVWACAAVVAQDTKPADPPSQRVPETTQDESLSKKLDRTDGVIVPPNADTDPAIRVPPPNGNFGSMRIIPPPAITKDGVIVPPQ